MALNIKHPEAEELVESLTALTGENKTQAVIGSLRERLARERRRRERDALSVELLEIGRRCAAHGRKDLVSDGDFLYDERGLPR